MELVTERLILREFRESDWRDILAYQVDPRYLRYYEWTDRTPEAVQEFVQMFLDQQQERPRTKFQLAVTLKDTHTLIGTCGIRMASASGTPFRWREGDIGYELSPVHWGHGYATEAARAVMRFGFTGLHLHRVWSGCIAENVGSARVLAKLGMRLEGRLRDKEYFKGRWWDTLLYAILEEEWREQQQNRKREPASPSLRQAGRHVGRSTPEDPGRLSDKERYSTMNDKTHPRANARHPAASRPRTAPYTASDLPIDEEGRIYHLQLKPGQIAPDILIVGDPGRAKFIASTFFSDLEFEHEHRGLVTVTGTSDLTGEPATIVSPLKTTVATSGIGTSSLEIVVQELVALTEIDFTTRTHKPDFPRLHIVRVGTSGALQASTVLGTPIITSYAIGMDNTGLFYEAPYPDQTCERLERELDGVVQRSMSADSRFYGKIRPYVTRAEPALVDALLEASARLGVPTKLGLTASNSGFYAPQGRDIARVRPSVPELDRILSEYDPGIGGQRIENMEMEASFLIHFLGGLGHWGGAICTTVANRREDTFAYDYQEGVRNSIRVALLALAIARSRS